MKDKRTSKNQHDEVDVKLMDLSDTNILLEFSKLLTSSYPHLIRIGAFCYDPYDNFAESLYYNFVYTAFSSKYGAIIDSHQIHRYGFTLHSYHKIHHIEIKPKSYPLTLVSKSIEHVSLTEGQLKNKELIFISFGDTINNLSGHADEVDAKTVNFNFTEFAMIDNKTGLYFRNANHFWVENSLIDYELVLDDYSKEEHQYYKQNFYAD